MNAQARIALFTEQAEKGGGPLCRAFAARDIECVPLSLRDCGFDVGGPSHGLHLPRFGEHLPRAAIVRFVPGGTFEEVTARLGLLHALVALGVPVCNTPTAIERCVDKAATSFHLARHGIATPRTWVCDDFDAAAAIVRAEARIDAPLVLKPLFGAQGLGLRLVSGVAELPPAEEVGGIYYLQRHVGTPPSAAAGGWRDLRVLVCDGRPVAAMERHGKGWITNIRQGARAERVAADGPAGDMAVAAARAVGAVLAGVDLIRDRAAGWQVLEVNSMPAWTGLQRVHDADITQIVADGLLRVAGLAAEAVR